MSCEYEKVCLNASKCFRCYGQKLLKLPYDKTKNAYKASTKKDLKKDDSWKNLEQDVANVLNKVPKITEARRSVRSGALPFEKGDVVDDILHPECKERTGRFLKTGDQSISLQKSILEKAKDEIKGTDKTMCLPFRFKGDENIYCIIDMDDLAALVTTMKAYIRDNELKEMQLKELLKK